MQCVINNANLMHQLGHELYLCFQSLSLNECVIYLQGDLGSGKTTLVQGFLKKAGIHEPITSPTYTLVETYNIDNHVVYHFDLYRLETPIELDAIGIRDYFEQSSYSFIEWPEKGIGALPQPDLIIALSTELNQSRVVNFSAQSPSGKQIISYLQESPFG